MGAKFEFKCHGCGYTTEICGGKDRWSRVWVGVKIDKKTIEKLRALNLKQLSEQIINISI